MIVGEKNNYDVTIKLKMMSKLNISLFQNPHIQSLNSMLKRNSHELI